MCRIEPYHEFEHDYDVIECIKKGRAPSNRPRGPRARLVNDPLWKILTTCWHEQQWRPTPRSFLDKLAQMLEAGEVSTSPALLDFFSAGMEGQLVSWPEDLLDLSGAVVVEKGRALASSQRSKVWR